MTLQASVLIRRSIACVVFVWAMAAASASANTILSIDPATTTVNVGDTFSVNINIAGVVDLFSYNFDLFFNPDILSFQSIVEGDFPKSGIDPAPETSFFTLGEENPGVVSFVTNSIFGPAGASGSGTLAIATFLAMMAGETTIDFETEFPPEFAIDLTFSDSHDNPIVFSAINAGSVQVNGVATVPEEPSAIILLTAALALAACRWLADAS